MRRFCAALGSLGDLEVVVGVSFDALDPILVETAARQHVEGDAGAIHRQPPVVVAPDLNGLPSVWPRSTSWPGRLASTLAILSMTTTTSGTGVADDEPKHAEAEVVHEADQQTLVRLLHLDVGRVLRRQPLERFHDVLGETLDGRLLLRGLRGIGSASRLRDWMASRHWRSRFLRRLALGRLGGNSRLHAGRREWRARLLGERLVRGIGLERIAVGLASRQKLVTLLRAAVRELARAPSP